MIAPALAPATHFQVLLGFVGCSANPQSAPANPSPLTPPPRKTPSASVIQSTVGSSRGGRVTRDQPQILQGSPVRAAWFVVLLPRCYHGAARLATGVTRAAASPRVPRARSAPPSPRRRARRCAT